MVKRIKGMAVKRDDSDSDDEKDGAGSKVGPLSSPPSSLSPCFLSSLTFSTFVLLLVADCSFACFEHMLGG